MSRIPCRAQECEPAAHCQQEMDGAAQPGANSLGWGPGACPSSCLGHWLWTADWCPVCGCCFLRWHTLVSTHPGHLGGGGGPLASAVSVGPVTEGSTDEASVYRELQSLIACFTLLPSAALPALGHPCSFPSSSDRKPPLIQDLPQPWAVQPHAQTVLPLLGVAFRSAGECSSYLIHLSVKSI